MIYSEQFSMKQIKQFTRGFHKLNLPHQIVNESAVHFCMVFNIFPPAAQIICLPELSCSCIVFTWPTESPSPLLHLSNVTTSKGNKIYLYFFILSSFSSPFQIWLYFFDTSTPTAKQTITFDNLRCFNNLIRFTYD